MGKKTAKSSSGRFPNKPTTSERKDRPPGGYEMEPGVVQPPNELNDDGQWMWNQVLENVPVRIATRGDSMLLFALCQEWSSYCYWSKLSLDPDTTTAYKATCMRSGCWKNLVVGLGKFGLTPLDRPKIKATGKEEKDDVETWLGVVG